MFKDSLNGKGIVYGPNGKRIMASMEYTLMIYNPSGKGMVFWNIVFPSGNPHDKKWKSCTIKDTMSIKISFMHDRNCITWTRVKLPVVFEEFEMIYIFWLFFLFTVIINWRKVNFSQNLGGLLLLTPGSTALLLVGKHWKFM